MCAYGVCMAPRILFAYACVYPAYGPNQISCELDFFAIKPYEPNDICGWRWEAKSNLNLTMHIPRAKSDLSLGMRIPMAK